MAKRWTAKVVLAAALLAATLALPGASAVASTCPAPGTGLAGAMNMTAAGAGMAHAMSVNNPNGNLGMYTAVHHTAC